MTEIGGRLKITKGLRPLRIPKLSKRAPRRRIKKNEANIYWNDGNLNYIGTSLNGSI